MKIDGFNMSNQYYRMNGMDKAENNAKENKLQNTIKKMDGFKHAYIAAIQNPDAPDQMDRKASVHTDRIELASGASNAEKANWTDTLQMMKANVVKDIQNSDAEKLKPIQDQVASGTYQIDVHEIAKKMIEFYI